MSDSLQAELFSLLVNNLQEVSNDEMKNAYETFVKEIEILNQSETDFKTIFRILNITRIEFRTLQAQILCEQGKICLKICIVRKQSGISITRLSR